MKLLILLVILDFCDPMFEVEKNKKLVLSDKKTQLLFEKCNLEKSEELTELQNWSSLHVFKTEDGKVLCASLSRNGKIYFGGVLYGSEEYFIKTVKEFWEEVDFMNSFQPFTCDIMNERFISEIPTSINKLQTTFGLPKDSLDFTMESLKRVDKVLKKAGMKAQAKSYLDAISYMGEVVRKEVEGSEWKMTMVSEGDCRPSIVNGNKEYDPFFLYYESISEKQPSLWESAYIEIERNKLR